MSPGPSRRVVVQAAMLGLAGCTRGGGGQRDWRGSLDDERARRRVPGAVIAILRRGVHAEYVELGELGRDSVVEVASLSKPVFAYAVLSEAARGAVELDGPLAAIAPPPYRHASRASAERFDDPLLALVTPRMLLTHRAGLPNWSRDRPLAFEAPPGAGWRYSGEGYVLLQQALEARGESLELLARRAVFAPLGMTRSTFVPHANATQGHDRDGHPVSSSVDAPNAATSLASTAADYATFVRRLVDAPADDPIVEELVAPQVSADAALRLSWGTGVALAEPGGWLFHWGANPGFRALFVGDRAHGDAVVILTNGDGGMALAARVVREQLGELPLLGFRLLDPAE